MVLRSVVVRYFQWFGVFFALLVVFVCWRSLYLHTSYPMQQATSKEMVCDTGGTQCPRTAGKTMLENKTRKLLYVCTAQPRAVHTVVLAVVWFLTCTHS